MGSAPSALAGPSGNRETFLWLAEPGARARSRRWTPGDRRAVHPPPPDDTHDAVGLLLEIARRRRITLRLTPDEAGKHEIETSPFIEIADDPGEASTSHRPRR